MFTFQDFSVEGLPISFAFENAGGVSSVNAYCENVVMKMGEDARDFIINIIPLVLRISVDIVYVDERNRGNKEMLNQHYEARTPDYFFELNDSLNLHKEVINLFLKTGHYDIIYKRDWFEGFETLISKDWKTEELRLEDDEIQ